MTLRRRTAIREGINDSIILYGNLRIRATTTSFQLGHFAKNQVFKQDA